MEAIKGQRTVNEIASAYGVHPNQVTPWKKPARELLPEIFSTGRVRSEQAEEDLRNQRYQQIGQLQVELDWLKTIWSAPLRNAGEGSSLQTTRSA